MVMEGHCGGEEGRETYGVFHWRTNMYFSPVHMR